MKIASWNIAGGHTIKSHDHFDYNPESLDYFVEQLRALDPDVICLQEVHTGDSDSNAAAIAAALGGYQIFNTPISPSHILEGKRLGLAILTRETHAEATNQFFPSPSGQLYFKNGNPATTHKKGLQCVTYQDLHIANTQLLPIGVFGRSYRDERDADLTKAINDVFAELPQPLILCGDFGMDNGQEDVFADSFDTLGLQNSLPAESTYHQPSVIDGSIVTTDAVYYSSGSLRTVSAGIIQTQTDHYLCWAEIERM